MRRKVTVSFRVEVVLGEKREVLRAGADDVFDEVNDVLVREVLGLLPFLRVEFGVELVPEVPRGGDLVCGGAVLLKVGDVPGKPLHLFAARGARVGALRQEQCLLHQLAALAVVHGHDEAVFRDDRLLQERELLLVEVAEARVVERGGALEEVALDRRLVGGLRGDVSLDLRLPRVARSAGIAALHGGVHVVARARLGAVVVAGVAQASRVVPGSSECDGVEIDRYAFLLPDVAHRDGEDERARGVRAAVAVGALVEGLFVVVVRRQHLEQERLALRVGLRHRVRVRGRGDTRERPGARGGGVVGMVAVKRGRLLRIDLR